MREMRMLCDVFHRAAIASQPPRLDLTIPRWSHDPNAYNRVRFRKQMRREGRPERWCRNCSGTGHYAKGCDNPGAWRPSLHGLGGTRHKTLPDYQVAR